MKERFSYIPTYTHTYTHHTEQTSLTVTSLANASQT